MAMRWIESEEGERLPVLVHGIVRAPGDRPWVVGTGRDGRVRKGRDVTDCHGGVAGADGWRSMSVLPARGA